MRDFQKLTRQTRFIGCLLAVMLVAPACAGGINKSINVEDGGQSKGQSSVNGSITIGDDVVVSGGLDTVNGDIRIGSNSRVRDVDTVNGGITIKDNVATGDINSVNGSIRIGENVEVDGEVNAVNGGISLRSGTTVSEGVGNVNGDIDLRGSVVGRDLSTVNGDVTLADESTLRGDLLIEKPGGWGWNNKRHLPTIVIGPGSSVMGTIVLEREVKLFISESATVGGVSGEMSMADAVRFSGERP